MLPVVSQALSEFNTAMKELQVHNQVMTFTASDFARTLTQTDAARSRLRQPDRHEGAVNGGLVHGGYPDPGLGNSLDTGRGRLIPTRQSTVSPSVCWFGVPDAALGDIFPNLNRFYSIGYPPIGFPRDTHR